VSEEPREEGRYNPLVWSKVLADIPTDALYRMTETTIYGHMGLSVEDDEKQAVGVKYTINSLGYRSPEFTNTSADILALGCSQTFGIGVQDNEIWPELLSNMLGMSYANLGQRGDSIYAMLGQAMAYVREKGKPKVIVALLPGWDRMEIGLNHEYNIVSPEIYSSWANYHVYQMAMSRSSSFQQDVPKYAKRPYVIDDILSLEPALSQSAKALLNLMDYCRALEVPLIFSSWHKSMIELLDIKSSDTSTNWDFSGYSRFDPAQLEDPNDVRAQCHAAERGTSQSWVIGLDTGRHLGSHAHLHYAEAFRDMIIDKQNKGTVAL
jgi:hypothetical protein